MKKFWRSLPVILIFIFWAIGSTVSFTALSGDWYFFLKTAPYMMLGFFIPHFILVFVAAPKSWPLRLKTFAVFGVGAELVAVLMYAPFVKALEQKILPDSPMPPGDLISSGVNVLMLLVLNFIFFFFFDLLFNRKEEN